MKFKIPRGVRTYFDDFLDTAGIEEQVFECEVIKDWVNNIKFTEKIEMYTPESKSYYENSDNRIDCRFKRESKIDKGDIIKTNTGEYYILDWKVLQEINNRATRAVRCNKMLTIYRNFKEEVDERGIVIKEAGVRPVIFEQPANVIQPQTNITNVSASSYSPGITPELLVNIVCQYNEETKEVRIGDFFDFGISTFVVVNVSYTNLDISGEFGILTIQTKKKPGGEEHGGNH